MERLDKLLLELKLVETRQKAVALIEDDGVKVDDKIVNKPGKKFSPEAKIELVKQPMKWVSRGALKLIEALDSWNISPEGKTCLDVGSSTGGFTEVLLSRRASEVVAVDSGSDQMVSTLREDPRVSLHEKTNFRNFLSQVKADLVVIDLSFISINLIWEPVSTNLNRGADVIALIKPQFEVGKDKLNKKGVVMHPKDKEKALQKAIDSAQELGFQLAGILDSPIKGGDGNHEYLIHLKWQK
ncbi:MAG: TlyA family RNA methyltransferase [Flavobacteriales bacterium]|nr:TlyA family RNA methyltransferase [Flavobacteriales bacterium]